MVSRKLMCACGEVFESSSPHAKRCQSCSMVFKRMYNKYMKSSGSSAVAMECATQEYEKRLRAGTLPSIERHKPVVQCRYCGAPTKREFCPHCVNEGFHSVFALTGRSNGWDSKHKSRVKVMDGWRGQRCAAGGRPQSSP